jgi:hypothetical protein
MNLAINNLNTWVSHKCCLGNCASEPNAYGEKEVGAVSFRQTVTRLQNLTLFRCELSFRQTVTRLRSLTLLRCEMTSAQHSLLLHKVSKHHKFHTG